jgi:hypothetical protein
LSTKNLLVILLIATVFFVPGYSFGQSASGGRLRVGVLDLENTGKDKDAAAAANTSLQQFIAGQGMVEIYNQARIEKEFAQMGRKLPARCRDPRTVLDVGGMINLDRMVYGTVDVTDKRCGVHLYLLDIVMRMAIGEASIQGEEGTPVDSVLLDAVVRLHGKVDSTKVIKKYLGPVVHNEKQMLMTSGACIGAGLIWGLVNYNRAKNSALLPTAGRTELLSNIPSSADQIPMFARPAALANAYVAASDDAYGVLYNPAGMAWANGPEAICGYQYRFGLDNIAASYVNKATREIGFGNAFLYSGDRDGLMAEMYFVSAVAYKFNRFIWLKRPVSLGMNVKIMSDKVKGATGGDDEFASSSISASSFGTGVDIGLLAELSDQIRYGCLIRDVPVFNKWNNQSTGERYNEALATTLHMGGTYQAGYTTFLIAEGQIPMYSDQSWKMSGGIEQEFFKVMFGRIGLQKVIQSAYDTPWKVTGGFGLRVYTVSLDGSYEYNTRKLFDVVNISVKIGL